MIEAEGVSHKSRQTPHSQNCAHCTHKTSMTGGTVKKSVAEGDSTQTILTI